MGKSKKRKKSKPNKTSNKGQRNKKIDKPKEPSGKRDTKHNKRKLTDEPENWEDELLDHGASLNSLGYTREETSVQDICPSTFSEESKSNESDTVSNMAAALKQGSPEVSKDATKIVQGQDTANCEGAEYRQVNQFCF